LHVPYATRIENAVTRTALCATCLVQTTGMQIAQLVDTLPRLIGA
jgi:hypothetical protein